MKKKQLIWIIPLVLVIGIIIGGAILTFGETKLMEGYDLYNCIYNNADNNDFSKNPYLIKKIQDECVCFREHNYKDLLEANC